MKHPDLAAVRAATGCPDCTAPIGVKCVDQMKTPLTSVHRARLRSYKKIEDTK